MNYRWLPATLKRILEPFLEDRTQEVRDKIEEALEAIRLNPYGPPFESYEWKGLGWHELPNSFVVLISENVVVRYQVMRDHPLIGLANIIDLAEGGPYGPNLNEEN